MSASRHEIYSLDGMAAGHRETCESIAESNRAIRRYDAGAHQLAISDGKVSVVGWASGTTGDQRAIVTRSISARTHAVFAKRMEDVFAERTEDDEERPAEPKPKKAKAPAKPTSEEKSKRARGGSYGRTFEWKGETRTVAQWGEHWGIEYTGINTRLRAGEEWPQIAERYEARARDRAKPAPYAPGHAKASTTAKAAPKASTRKTPAKAPAKPKLTHTRPKGAPGGVGEIALLSEALHKWGSLEALLGAAESWRKVREMVTDS